jgi:hypothetical protein
MDGVFDVAGAGARVRKRVQVGGEVGGLGADLPASHICTMARAWLRTMQVEPNAGSGISTPTAQAATSRPKASSAIPTACPRAQPPYGVAIEPSAGGDFAGDLAEHCVGHPPPERNQPLIAGIAQYRTLPWVAQTCCWTV